EPALTVAHHVGPTGRVVATDQSSQMLAVARSRAATRGLKNLEFVETDAETLNFPEGSLDAVTCRFGLMFLPDLSGTLQRIRRSLRPDGWFATAIWDVPPNVPMISLAMGVALKMFDVPPPPPGVPNLFALSQPGVLEKAFTAAGFTNLNAEMTHVEVEFRSGEEYTDFILEVAPPITTVVSRQPLERQQEFRAALSEAAQQYAIEGGRIRMVNSAICVAGQRGA
ncbi:MAG: class I SAM-dependent methyltransferase, partial [Ardenticatenaceae bacterium]